MSEIGKIESPENRASTEEDQEPEQSEIKSKAKPMSRRKFVKSLIVGAGLAAASDILYDPASQFLHSFEKREYEKSLANVIEKLKQLYSHNDQWIDSEQWANAIENAFKKNSLEATDENLALVLTQITTESGFREFPRAYDPIPQPSEDEFKKANIIQPRTGGPMEVGYAHLIDETKSETGQTLTYNQAYEQMNSMKGGIDFGVKHLKKIIEAYNFVEDPIKRLKCIFADYNAGIYASRNAGLQRGLNEKAKANLREDGILHNQSIDAVMSFFSQAGITLTREQVSADLHKASKSSLVQTETWQTMLNLCNNNLDPVPADRPVLGIYGVMKKLLKNIGNSREYAEAHYDEYIKILGVLKENKKEKTTTA